MLWLVVNIKSHTHTHNRWKSMRWPSVGGPSDDDEGSRPALDTTIVRLLCVRTVSLSGHILDRSYYISTKPTSPLLYILPTVANTKTTTTIATTASKTTYRTLPARGIYRISNNVPVVLSATHRGRFSIQMVLKSTRDRGPMNPINWQCIAVNASEWSGQNDGKRSRLLLYTYVTYIYIYINIYFIFSARQFTNHLYL